MADLPTRIRINFLNFCKLFYIVNVTYRKFGFIFIMNEFYALSTLTWWPIVFIAA